MPPKAKATISTTSWRPRLSAMLANAAPQAGPAQTSKTRSFAERGYKQYAEVARRSVEFSYRPRACKQDYRVIALRKNLSIERGEDVLFNEFRYFFYITDDRELTADQVIAEAHRAATRRT